MKKNLFILFICVFVIISQNICSGDDKSDYFKSKILGEDTATLSLFGDAVSISKNFAIVGSRLKKNGAAYIFINKDNKWKQHAKLTPLDNNNKNHFGCSVAISGTIAIIGAPFDSTKKNLSGAAYIFELVDNEWKQVSKLYARDADIKDLFGYSVSISGDFAIIGAKEDDEPEKSSGSAYIFRYLDNNWKEYAKLIPNDSKKSFRFGSTVQIHNNKAIIGSIYDNNGGICGGSVYIFEMENNIWSEKAKLIPEDIGDFYYFGRSVAIFDDYAIVGADGADGTGAAYIFKEDGKNWIEHEKLSLEDANEKDHFGKSVAIYGEYALIGADRKDEMGNASGAAYLYRLKNNKWNLQQKFLPDKDSDQFFFGSSVALSLQHAIIGVKYDKELGFYSGSSYIYYYNPIKYEIKPKLINVSANTDYGSFKINLRSGTGPVNFNISSSDSWLKIINGKSIVNNGVVRFEYETNKEQERTGTIIISSPDIGNISENVKVKQDEYVHNFYFTPVRMGGDVNAMKLEIIEVKGLNIDFGDEIAVFDNNNCVGLSFVNNKISAIGKVKVEALSDTDQKTDAVNGFISNNKILFRIWDQSAQKEYKDIIASFYDPSNNKPVSNVIFNQKQIYKVKLEIEEAARLIPNVEKDFEFKSN